MNAVNSDATICNPYFLIYILSIQNKLTVNKPRMPVVAPSDRVIQAGVAKKIRANPRLNEFSRAGVAQKNHSLSSFIAFNPFAQRTNCFNIFSAAL